MNGALLNESTALLMQIDFLLLGNQDVLGTDIN